MDVNKEQAYMGVLLLGIWLIFFSIIKLTLQDWLGIFGLITGIVLILDGLGAFNSVTWPWVRKA